MSEKIILNDKILIAKGSGRACYLHPKDDTKIIKIIYTEEGVTNNQNYVDYNYIKYLKKEKKNLEFISSCYEFIETNLGKGLIFDRVINYDKTESKSFRYFIAKKIIPIDEQEKLLEELNKYLIEEEILFIDNSLTNILCKKIKENRYKLIIVDGLGAKRVGLKFWLYLYSKLYRKYKIKKQWKKLMKSYKTDLKRTNLDKNPITNF